MIPPLWLLLLLLAACASPTKELQKKADALAAGGGMHKVEIPVGGFTLMVYERMAGPDAPVHVYIEGDGNAWLTSSMVSPDPTPIDPVGLRLALEDKALNVVYMGRICQYIMTDACAPKYWTHSQYNELALATYNQALHRWQGHPLELTGYSGGAAVALLVAAGRDDVIAIRTVAGNIDTDAFTTLHHISPLAYSLNPVSVMERTAKIPQRHFVGAKDTVIPVSLVKSYQERLPEGNCSAYNVVPGIDHYSGWPEQWPVLLDVPLPCAAANPLLNE